MTAKKIALLCTIIYCLLGNIVGYTVYSNTISADNFLFYIFIPYTFPWSLTAMVGADWLTFVLIAFAFGVSFALFFPVGIYFSKTKTK
jgi:uncharacterized membrane protein YpjA